VDGETLLDRAVRLLRENGITDIVITGYDERYRIEGTELYGPPGNRFEVDKFYSPRERWNRAGNTLFVYGDCFFTPEAIATMCTTPAEHGVQFFGRFGRSSITGKTW